MTRTSSGRAARSAASRNSSSSAVRNAASVLPEPVGAAISVWAPRRIALQPWVWAAVGSPKRLSHQRRRTGWKSWGNKAVTRSVSFGNVELKPGQTRVRHPSKLRAQRAIDKPAKRSALAVTDAGFLGAKRAGVAMTLRSSVDQAGLVSTPSPDMWRQLTRTQSLDASLRTLVSPKLSIELQSKGDRRRWLTSSFPTNARIAGRRATCGCRAFCRWPDPERGTLER